MSTKLCRRTFEVYIQDNKVPFYLFLFFMVNPTKLEYLTLNIFSKNYLARILDAQIHLIQRIWETLL